MVDAALLSLLATSMLWQCWLAARVRRLSKLASRATKRAPAPEKWESSLRELADEVSSLSSSHEKVQRLLMRLNSRAGMRELREERAGSPAPPPPGADKAVLRRFYGLSKSGPDFARAQLSLISKE